MRRALPAVLAVVLMAAASTLPLLRDVDQAVWLQITVPVLLVLAAGWSAWSGRGRLLLALAVATWTCVALLTGTGSLDLVVVATAVSLRLWAGVPELFAIGRKGVLDLLGEVTGGVCATGIVLLTALGTPAQAPTSLAVALVGGALLVLLGSVRLRR